MFTSFRKSLSSFRLILLSLFLSAFRRQVWIQLQGDVRKSFQVSAQTKPLNTFCCTWQGGNALLKVLSHLSSCCESARAPWAADTTSPSAPTEQMVPWQKENELWYSCSWPGRSFSPSGQGCISSLYPVGVSGHSQKQFDFSFMTESTFCSRRRKGDKGKNEMSSQEDCHGFVQYLVYYSEHWTPKEASIIVSELTFRIFLGISTYIS